MEVLLLTDIAGIGKKNDVISVKSGFALNHLLPLRKAMVVTPSVRKRYAEQIKKRALQRDTEKQVQNSLSIALSDKTLHITGKVSKTGKLYAAISEAQVAESLKKEFSIDLPASAIHLTSPLKSIGLHKVQVTLGAQKVDLSVDIAAEKAETPSEK